MFLPDGQKAPSAKRCIKTGQVFSHLGRNLCEVRKHRAPKGALRLFQVSLTRFVTAWVRKHRAPKGALRHGAVNDGQHAVCKRQKAPSAKRCIKTYSAEL